MTEKSDKVSRKRFLVQSDTGSVCIPSIDELAAEITPQNIKIGVEDVIKTIDCKKQYYVSLKVQLGDFKWTVYRTESDFYDLHSKVVAKKNKYLPFPSTKTKRKSKFFLNMDKVHKEDTTRSPLETKGRISSPTTARLKKSSERLKDSDLDTQEKCPSVKLTRRASTTQGPALAPSPLDSDPPKKSKRLSTKLPSIHATLDNKENAPPLPKSTNIKRTMSQGTKNKARSIERTPEVKDKPEPLPGNEKKKDPTEKPLEVSWTSGSGKRMEKIMSQKQLTTPKGSSTTQFNRKRFASVNLNEKAKCIGECVSGGNNLSKTPEEVHLEVAEPVFSFQDLSDSSVVDPFTPVRHPLSAHGECAFSPSTSSSSTPRSESSSLASLAALAIPASSVVGSDFIEHLSAVSSPGLLSTPFKNLVDIRSNKVVEYQNYVDCVLQCPEVLMSSAFRDLIDVTHNPSGFLMSKLSELRCSFQVQKEKDLYCVLYAGQIFVFKSITATSCLYSIDLQCSEIDLVTKSEPGCVTFEVREDRGKKVYTFKSRVETHAHEWILNCRRIRFSNKQDTDSRLEGDDYVPPLMKILDDESIIQSIDISENFKMGMRFETMASVLRPEDLILTNDSDKNVKYMDDGSFFAGTKAKLFEKVLRREISIWNFLLTSPLFSNPTEVFQLIQYKYEKYLQSEPKEEVLKNIIVFFVVWIKEFWCDFSANDLLINELKNFIEKINPPDRFNLTEDLQNLKDLFYRQIDEIPLPVPSNAEPKPPCLPLFFGPLKFDVFDVSPKELARQLTLRSFDIWKSIHFREFLYWNSSKRTTKSPNIVRFVEDFNDISKWFSGYVLSGNSPKQRGYYLMHAISILRKAFKLQNYHCTISGISALESSAISRLKKSWAHVTKEHLETLQLLKSYFSSTSNWKAYRDLLQGSSPPCIPHVGLFLSDVTFIDDGNKDVLGPNCLINWQKYELFSRVVALLRKFEGQWFPLVVVGEIQDVLERGKDLDETLFYQRSLLIEPRVQTKPQ